MTAWLRSQGYAVNRKRVTRLMQQMGLEAIYTSRSSRRRQSPASRTLFSGSLRVF